jgi:uracil-DNA glycosylase
MKLGRPVATGIALANTTDTLEKDYSPSLDVLKESVIDYTVPHRIIKFDPSLEKWETQGVLMLNSALSCEVGRVNIHSLLWRPFMKSLLSNMSKHTTGIVYVLMGSQAQSFEPYIDKRSNHIIRIRHPSWYARQKTRMPSDVWQEVNRILIGQNGYGIEWYEEV